MMAEKEKIRQILADSLKKIMRKVPFAKISIMDICEEAGTSRRNFYRYFPDKYALLNWIYLQELGNQFPKDDSMLIHDYVPFICKIVYEDRAFYANAFSVSGQNSFRSYCKERMYPKFMHDYGDVFLSDVSASFYVDHITEAIFDRIVMWLKSEPCMPPEEFANYMIESSAKVAMRMWENMQIFNLRKKTIPIKRAQAPEELL